MTAVPKDTAALRAALLAWYDAHARALPWRAGPGAATRTDPYRVWLSEVMLQQTTVPHATPYFETFTRRWPTVSDLAAVEDADLMAAWAGLGYYARARNLLACARAVANDHGGVFPDTEEALRALPGVGAYTAAAVAAIAFDRAANVVDGNVERVVARLFAVETPVPAARSELRRLAATLVADERPGDWAEGRATGEPERYPVKTKKAARPHREGIAWVLRDGAGRVALVRRPDKGLLGGTVGLPTSAWTVEAPDATPPVAAGWTEAGAVDHVFTHFSLTLTVRVATGSGDFLWTPEAEALAALPTVFRKALERGLAS